MGQELIFFQKVTFAIIEPLERDYQIVVLLVMEDPKDRLDLVGGQCLIETQHKGAGAGDDGTGHGGAGKNGCGVINHSAQGCAVCTQGQDVHAGGGEVHPVAEA